MEVKLLYRCYRPFVQFLMVKDWYLNDTNRVAMIYVVSKVHSVTFDSIPKCISISHSILAVYGKNLPYKKMVQCLENLR